MSRKRWTYTSGGEPIKDENGNLSPIEISDDYRPEPVVRTQISMDRHYENTCATDGTDIGSRRKHQEYMRRNGLTIADDFKNTWAKAQQERDEFKTTGRDSTRREAVERALCERQTQGKRR